MASPLISKELLFLIQQDTEKIGLIRMSWSCSQSHTEVCNIAIYVAAGPVVVGGKYTTYTHDVIPTILSIHDPAT